MASQNARLLNWLESHDGITTLEATSLFKICRLSERIREMESLGYRFSHDSETTPHGARVVRYRLQKAAPQVSPRMESTSMPTPSPAGAAPLRKERMFGREVEIVAEGISAHDGTHWISIR